MIDDYWAMGYVGIPIIFIAIITLFEYDIVKPYPIE